MNGPVLTLAVILACLQVIDARARKKCLLELVQRKRKIPCTFL